jgi:Family of unknown function (DUF6152)
MWQKIAKSSGKPMVLFVLLLMTAATQAHHSTAIYDSEHPLELAGTVVEWKFTNPHCIIALDVKAADGSVQRWNVEGGNTSGLFRNGWTPATLKPGDAIMLTVRPLRSGAFGGNYSNPRWQDGQPVIKSAVAR